MATSLFKGLDHIGIKTVHMDSAIQFYSEILGFELLKRVRPRQAELAFLQLGGTVLELVEITDGGVYEDGVVNHLAIQVEDVFKATDWLKAKKVTLLQDEPMAMGDGRYNLFFRGPSGEKLELFQGVF